MSAADTRTLLALDTATEACSVALLRAGRVRCRYEELGRGHGERILDMVRGLLDEAQLRLTDLDAVAVGCGPGGFTGVRLGIGVAQGLAFGAGLPVLGVSDLRAVAQRAFELAPSASRCLVCSDARMQEVYTACYRRDSAGLATLDTDVATARERVCPPADVHVEASPGLIAAGRGLRAYATLRERVASAGLPCFDDLLPSAEQLVRLAAADLAAGRAIAADRLQPVYLRDRVAEPASRG